MQHLPCIARLTEHSGRNFHSPFVSETLSVNMQVWHAHLGTVRVAMGCSKVEPGQYGDLPSPGLIPRGQSDALAVDIQRELLSLIARDQGHFDPPTQVGKLKSVP